MRPLPKPHPFLLALIPYLCVGLGLGLLRNAWIAMLFYQVLMVIAILFWGKKSVKQRTLHSRRILAFVTASLSGFALYFAWDFIGIHLDAHTLKSIFGLNFTQFTILALYLSLTNPWLEEQFWRGILADSRPVPAWQDLAFAGYHLLVVAWVLDWYWWPLVLLALAGAAWWWRQLARHEGGLNGVVWTHLLADFAIMLALWLRLRSGA
jgi:hypothetical protein